MEVTVDRRTILAAVGTTSLAGCLGGGRTDSSQSPSTEPATENDPQSSDRADGVDVGGPPTADETLPLPLAPAAIRDHAVSGGPPKDGIPSIDDPSFVAPNEASETIAPGDPVFGLTMGNETKAYPQSILVRHEICNDVVDGQPVAVTYCPLTGTAMGFERGETTLGVSGRLVNNNLIMYDRATETWWPQVLATAIPGVWNADPPVRSLREFRVVWTTWERWRTQYPDTAVLSRDTGYAKNYDVDPYGSYNPRGGYYSPETRPMFRALSEDDRLEPKELVIGARTKAGAVALRKDRLRAERVLEGELAGTPVLATYEPNLDTGYVYRNPNEVEFELRDGQFVTADAEPHPPDALPLERLLAFDAMWFAWSGFYPDTTLYA